MIKTERYSILALIILMLMCNLTACGAVNNTIDNGGNSIEYADALNGLGLFFGTDNGYELDNPVTRVQAAVMLVRFVGSEDKAINGSNTHPFTDIPDWADKYVAYLYTSGLTRGVSETLFQSNDLSDLQMYTTFLLRALKYDEGSDFTYNTAVSKAHELGIIKEISESGNFLRGDMVTISYFALNAKIKGTSGTLLDKLVANGVVSAESAKPVQDLFAWEAGTDNNSSTVEIKPSEGKGAENSMTNIIITVGGSVFSARLYDNDTARDFLTLLPMTLNMSELNGNEKYYNLSDRLLTDSERVESINSGDLMLYGSDCLVLFYKSFSTGYSYTKLGYIKDVSELAAALGNGSIQVSFAIGNQ